MMNDKILQNYQLEVLELFKVHYRKMSAKDMALDFTTVLQSTFCELGIIKFSPHEVEFLKTWFDTIHHQLFITNMLNDGQFNEIIFHSNTEAQKIYSDKKEIIEFPHLTPDDYQLSFEIMAQKNNIAWNFSVPFASFSTSIANQEFRITLIHHSTSANRISKIFLRSLQKINPRLSLFNENESTMELLIGFIKNKKNILISGSTGSGKTTFLRALLSEISPEEHVVVLEDTHEILTFSPHQTSFLSHDDLLKKSLKDYCAYALRMSPDRLIVGEMRSTEVVPYMLAMNTGHKGLMSTIHANSCVDALSRIALLFSLYSENKEIDFSLITKLACKNIDYVIHMENKNISEICRVIGSEGETPFYEIIYEKNFARTS
ncbi:MAG: Flp pilus assembly complex ATPase component TadA [Bacteriovorax sp.]|nr:Flp pilus assembly complex ATPase component TadA [Bacteriovorax sp.]